MATFTNKIKNFVNYINQKIKITGGYLLLENNDGFLTLENGDKIILTDEQKSVFINQIKH